ncbi:MAG: hypothetical protein GY847_25640 [Proteobacteria bacterium]|nr:hypothetical protein [Pseudomonadota bacterium]
MSNATTVETQTKVSLGNDKQNRKKEATEMQETTNQETQNEAPNEAPEEANPFDEMEGDKALEEIRSELEKIPANEVRKLTASTTQVVGIGLAYAQSYKEDRGLFQGTFIKEAFDVRSYDNMEKRANAFWHLDILKRQTEGSLGPVQSLLEVGVPLRAKLLKGAFYLWEDHAAIGDLLAQIRAGNGHANSADDLGSLATLFHDHWKEAAGRCSITKEEIVEARRVGAAILRAKSPIKTKELDEICDLRYRAGEYLRRGIEDIRAGAYFIHRGNPEALDRYPSIFARIKRSRQNEKNGKNDQEIEQTPKHAVPFAEPVSVSDISKVA